MTSSPVFRLALAAAPPSPARWWHPHSLRIARPDGTFGPILLGRRLARHLTAYGWREAAPDIWLPPGYAHAVDNLAVARLLGRLAPVSDTAGRWEIGHDWLDDTPTETRIPLDQLDSTEAAYLDFVFVPLPAGGWRIGHVEKIDFAPLVWFYRRDDWPAF